MSTDYPSVKISGTVAADITTIALPAGASTSQNQSTEISTLSSILAQLANILAKLQGTLTVSASSLPLPTNAAQDATIQSLLDKYSSSVAAITISTAIPVNPNSVKIVSANPNRKGLVIYNNSANSIYIAFGSAANSSNNMTIILATFASYSMPWPIYKGDIYATRNAGSGNALITELT